MAPKFLTHLPGLRWIPHDIPPRAAPKRSRNPFSSAARERVGGLKADLHAGDARALAQGQSMFFARLPAELRKMVYDYVMGSSTVHLTMGSRKRFGHFVCDAEDECGCRVLVGGKEGTRLDGGCVALLRTCRRMCVLSPPPVSQTVPRVSADAAMQVLRGGATPLHTTRFLPLTSHAPPLPPHAPRAHAPHPHTAHTLGDPRAAVPAPRACGPARVSRGHGELGARVEYHCGHGGTARAVCRGGGSESEWRVGAALGRVRRGVVSTAKGCGNAQAI
jgi:hypothetical protein